MMWMSRPRRVLLVLLQLLLFPLAISTATNINYQSSKKSSKNKCEGDIVNFERFLLLSLTGRPQQVTEQDLARLEEAFVDAYNDGVYCGQDGAYRMLEEAVIVPDIVDGFGDDFDTGLNDLSTSSSITRDFVYVMIARGSCIGCDETSRLWSEPMTTNEENSSDERYLAQATSFLRVSMENHQQQSNMGVHPKSMSFSNNGRAKINNSVVRGWRNDNLEQNVIKELPENNVIYTLQHDRDLSDNSTESRQTEYYYNMEDSNSTKSNGSKNSRASKLTRNSTTSTISIDTNSTKSSKRSSKDNDKESKKSKKGRELCSCDGPDQGEFIADYNDLYFDYLIVDTQTGIRRLKDNAIDSISGASELELLDRCDRSNTQELTAVVILDILQSDQDILESDLRLLEDAFLESYNHINILNDEICDTYFREITNVTIDEQTGPNGLTRQRTRKIQETDQDGAIKSLRCTVTYICLDCPDDIGLFQDSNNDSNDRRHRKLQDFNTTCLCPLDARRRGPRERDFLDALDETLNLLKEKDTTNPLQFYLKADEIVPLRQEVCESVEEEFNTTILVEVRGRKELTTEDQERFEQVIVETYNDLTQQYCDPFFRSIIDAEIVEIARDTPDGATPLVIELTVSCRGCSPDNEEIYSSPAPAADTIRSLLSIESNQRFRSLQQDDICYCSVDSSENRAPTEVEFISALLDEVRDLELSTLRSVVRCDVSNIFETTLIFQIEGDPNAATDAELEAFVEAIIESYNTIDESEGTCDPEFRTLISSSLFEIGVELNDELEDTGGIDIIGRRLSLSVLLYNNKVANRQLDEVNFFLLLIYMSGSCNGCPNDSDLFDDTSNRRHRELRQLLGLGHYYYYPYQEYNTQDSHQQLIETDTSSLLSLRHLQNDYDTPESTCYCPIDSDIRRRRKNSFDNDLRDRVRERRDRGEITFANEVDESAQVITVECVSTPSTFVTTAVMDLNANLVAITQEQTDMLATAFRDTYNDLSSQYCDSLFRRVLDVSISDYEELETPGLDGFGRVRATMIITGRCRGCEDGAEILLDLSTTTTAARTRELMQVVLDDRTMRRRIQNTRLCFCSIDSLANRIPSDDEFFFVFGPVVDGLNLASVLSVVQVGENMNNEPSQAPSATPSSVPSSLLGR